MTNFVIVVEVLVVTGLTSGGSWASTGIPVATADLVALRHHWDLAECSSMFYFSAINSRYNIYIYTNKQNNTVANLIRFIGHYLQSSCPCCSRGRIIL